MHFSAPTLLAAAALIPSSMAHFCFNKLIVDGNYTGTYEYVRQNNNSNSPVTDITSTDLRCNSGGLLTGSTTSTYTVAAGSSVGFGLDTAIGHPGPLQVYMSKAPDSSTAAEYDGSGDWFKVYEMGPAEITSAGLQWASSEIQNFTFTLPEETPAGQYLLRAESIALHGAETVGGAQFYISCAQIEVTSDSTATPAPVVDIPGLYTGEEPGILINIYYPIPTNYTMPGPAVWPSDGTSNSTTTTSNSTIIAVSTTAAVSTSVAVSSVAVSSVAVSSVAVSSAVAVSSSAAVVTTQAAVITSSAAYYPTGANSTIAGPTSFTTSTRPLTTGTSTSTSGTAAKYSQCGGSNWTGATSCESGSTCTVQNDFYSQCI